MLIYIHYLYTIIYNRKTDLDRLCYIDSNIITNNNNIIKNKN